MERKLEVFSLDNFHKQYPTKTKNITIGDRRFSILVPKNIEPFVDSEELLHEFPLWAKIWEASVILAEHLAGTKADADCNTLEIGCGLGFVGIVASAFGHNMTITEYGNHALNFARANAQLNRQSGDAELDIRRLDWNKPEIEGTFDRIVGSEVIYKKEDYEPILQLFQKYLNKDGEIYLAEGLRETSYEFFRQMSDIFDIEARRKVIRTPEKEIRVILAKMTFKS
jgi:predicted nicotinamide N-methyase